MNIKTDTHLVLKWELIRDRLDFYEKQTFQKLVDKITSGINKEYLVCNKDEPYACKVLEIILLGELDKEKAKGVLKR